VLLHDFHEAFGNFVGDEMPSPHEGTDQQERWQEARGKTCHGGYTSAHGLAMANCATP